MEAHEFQQQLVTSSSKRTRIALHKDCLVAGCRETFPFSEKNHVALHQEREKRASAAAAATAAHASRRAAVAAIVTADSDNECSFSAIDDQDIFSAWQSMITSSVVPQQPLPPSSLALRRHAFHDALRGFHANLSEDLDATASADAVMDDFLDTGPMDDDEAIAAVATTTVNIPVR